MHVYIEYLKFIARRVVQPIEYPNSNMYTLT